MLVGRATHLWDGRRLRFVHQSELPTLLRQLSMTHEAELLSDVLLALSCDTAMRTRPLTASEGVQSRPERGR